jgi:carbamoyl-phosphate synthase large subunit
VSHEPQGRVESSIAAAREHDHRVRMGGRRLVRLRPYEEHRHRDEPQPNEQLEGQKETAPHGTTVPSAAVTAVLFTCAGQRVDIVTAFRRAGARTIAVDVNALAPALYHADEHAFVPRVTDPAYVSALAELVAAHDVALVVPLTDLDHDVLSRARDALGTTVLLPGPEIVEALADKWLAHLLFVERGIGSPPTWLPADVPGDLEFPVLVKARRGFGSRNIFRCHDRRELDFFLGYTNVDSMVQACCSGEEFSVDVFCDLEGRCLNAVPRTMIESKGGESIKGMTIRDPELIEVGRHVSETLGLVGPANIQCFREPDGTHRVTDINPRFGGGFPLPTAAGSRYPELALALAAGERPEPRLGDFREGLYMTRFFSELVLSAGEGGTLEPFAEELPEPVAEP